MTKQSVIQQIVGNYIKVENSYGQKQEAVNMKRKRKSLFGLSVNEEVVKNQNKYFPRYMKLVVFSISFMYSLALIIIIVGQLINLSLLNTCDNMFDNTDLWQKGCIIKIPYCKRSFIPKCNCVSLHIENDYSLKQLPLKITTEMDGLRKIYIKNGNLTTLPKEMENLKEMFNFELSFNQLQEFNVNVLQWPRLTRLSLEFNNITKCNEHVWLHPELTILRMSSNIGLGMPQDVSKIILPNLLYLDLGNNSVQIPNELSSNQLPAILFLYLDGNKMEMLPSKFDSFSKTVVRLSNARCGLISLSGLEEFERLIYLDARNNSISSISENMKNMMKSKTQFESYFSGNPLCYKKENSDINCAKLCTDYCWSETGFDNGICDTTCGSKECNYDGGDCA